MYPPEWLTFKKLNIAKANKDVEQLELIYCWWEYKNGIDTEKDSGNTY